MTIYIKIQAGFGNQLFQYAMGYVLAKRFKCSLKLDISFYQYFALKKKLGFHIPPMFEDCYLSHLTIEPNFFVGGSMLHIMQVLAKKYNWRHVLIDGQLLPYRREDFGHCRDYQPNLLTNIPDKGVYLEGFWQNAAYFAEARGHLQDITEPRAWQNIMAANMASEIKKTESVGIHIRRGDFVKLGWDSGSDFYKRGISQMRKVLGRCNFYVFTDDKLWAKENLKDVDNLQIMDFPVLDEFFLLKCCHHQIVSESTFGWWAAYLNAYPDKIVIIPQKFSGSLVDDGWIKM